MSTEYTKVLTCSHSSSAITLKGTLKPDSHTVAGAGAVNFTSGTIFQLTKDTTAFTSGTNTTPNSSVVVELISNGSDPIDVSGSARNLNNKSIRLIAQT